MHSVIHHGFKSGETVVLRHEKSVHKILGVVGEFLYVTNDGNAGGKWLHYTLVDLTEESKKGREFDKELKKVLE